MNGEAFALSTYLLLRKKKDGDIFVDPSPYTIILLIAYDEKTSLLTYFLFFFFFFYAHYFVSGKCHVVHSPNRAPQHHPTGDV